MSSLNVFAVVLISISLELSSCWKKPKARIVILAKYFSALKARDTLQIDYFLYKKVFLKLPNLEAR